MKTITREQMEAFVLESLNTSGDVDCVVLSDLVNDFFAQPELTDAEVTILKTVLEVEGNHA
jgi:hypothetical protein